MLDEEARIRRSAEHEILRRVAELNQKYEANDFNGTREGEQNYKIIAGRIQVLVSAPHTVRQLRDGAIKERDGMTGGIAEYLCGRFGLWGMIRTWNVGDDPNYNDDERSREYRQKVVDLVREQGIEWVIDLHGCLNKYGFDMDVGVNGGKNLTCDLDEVERMVQCWRDLGLDARVDERFVAWRERTVSKYVHCATGANCLQIEASGRIRTTGEGLEKFCVGFETILSTLHV